MRGICRLAQRIETCVVCIPYTKIWYRPHVLAIAFCLLVPVVLYHDSTMFTDCREILSYRRHECYSGPHTQTESDCLQHHVTEIEQCCDLETACKSDEPTRVHALECKVEQCYFGVYNPDITWRSLIMAFILICGGFFSLVGVRQIQADPVIDI